ncbi:MAG: hypothetical protein IT159_03480 [Bryobacterales bacterium]|nr:hypothetical protein [Bryobacterales bacterium]
MNIGPGTRYGCDHAALVGCEGELKAISIAADARHLEQLLDALAELPFPVNPQIRHSGMPPVTTVEFPAYAAQVSEVRSAIADRGFDPASVSVKSMLDQIRGGGRRIHSGAC